MTLEAVLKSRRARDVDMATPSSTLTLSLRCASATTASLTKGTAPMTASPARTCGGRSFFARCQPTAQPRSIWNLLVKAPMSGAVLSAPEGMSLADMLAMTSNMALRWPFSYVTSKLPLAARVCASITPAWLRKKWAKLAACSCVKAYWPSDKRMRPGISCTIL